MKNSITARVEFSYKGESYAPATVIDLDRCLDANGHLPDLHQMIARANGIDTYSYLYEVMESHEILFEDATGIAAECLHDGDFDAAGFEQRWQEQHHLEILAPIARRHLNIDNLEQHPDLKAALLETYLAGRDAAQSQLENDQ